MNRFLAYCSICLVVFFNCVIELGGASNTNPNDLIPELLSTLRDQLMMLKDFTSGDIFEDICDTARVTCEGAWELISPLDMSDKVNAGYYEAFISLLSLFPAGYQPNLTSNTTPVHTKISKSQLGQYFENYNKNKQYNISNLSIGNGGYDQGMQYSDNFNTNPLNDSCVSVPLTTPGERQSDQYQDALRLASGNSDNFKVGDDVDPYFGFYGSGSSSGSDRDNPPLNFDDNAVKIPRVHPEKEVLELYASPPEYLNNLPEELKITFREYYLALQAFINKRSILPTRPDEKGKDETEILGMIENIWNLIMHTFETQLDENFKNHLSQLKDSLISPIKNYIADLKAN